MNHRTILDNTKGISVHFRNDARGPHVAIFHQKLTWYAMMPIDDKQDVEFCEFIKSTNAKIDRLTEEQIARLRSIRYAPLPFSSLLDLMVKS